MVINHPQIMSWNVGIIKKRLNLDSTILLQDHYQKIIVALSETNRLMKQIDKINFE